MGNAHLQEIQLRARNNKTLEYPGGPRPPQTLDRAIHGGEADCALRDHFFKGTDTLMNLLREADDVNLSKVRFGSPITPLLRFNIGEAFWLLVAHENRHLLQIQRICAHTNYPRT